MLQISFIKENKEAVIKGLLIKRHTSAEEDINKVLSLDESRISVQQEMDASLAESNKKAKEIGALMKQGKKEEVEEAKKYAAQLRDKSNELRDALKVVEEELRQLLYKIPNVPHESVPEGNSDEDNIEIFKNDITVELKDSKEPHWDLIKKYDIIDFELGNKITGAGFPVYKGKGARLQRALINFFLNEATDKGYKEIIPPIVVNEDSGMATGQLPDKEGQMYHIAAEDLYLIPTAEVPITNLYRDVMLSEADLPVKLTGFTPCFRREAGSWGAHVRGLNRLHQFDKVEIVEIQKPENSEEALIRMRDHVCELLEKLGLPYRILRLCGGDLGFTSTLTYDMEVYSAAQEQWLEVSSVSNFETYQANRLKLRYKDSDKKKHLLHTLNGSALALPRIVAAILENNQTSKGIKIPEVLVPFCGFDMID